MIAMDSATNKVETKSKQLGFKITPTLFNLLELAAKKEDRKTNEFARRLFELVFKKYLEVAESTHPHRVFERLQEMMEDLHIATERNDVVPMHSPTKDEIGSQQVGAPVRRSAENLVKNLKEAAAHVASEHPVNRFTKERKSKNHPTGTE